MLATGRCYCGQLEFQVEVPDRAFRGQCHCHECQKISGGSPNVFLIAPEVGFSYARGTVKTFTRADLENPVTREFCGDCGTPILTRNPHEAPGAVILKAGALDDQEVYGGPVVAIHAGVKVVHEGECSDLDCRDDADCPDGQVCELGGRGCDMPVCVPRCHDDLRSERGQSYADALCVTCPCLPVCV